MVHRQEMTHNDSTFGKVNTSRAGYVGSAAKLNDNICLTCLNNRDILLCRVCTILSNEIFLAQKNINNNVEIDY